MGGGKEGGEEGKREGRRRERGREKEGGIEDKVTQLVGVW